MSPRTRLIIAGGLTVLLLGGAAAYGATAFASYSARQNAPSQVATTSQAKTGSEPRVIFRNTATGAGYGLVASVPLSDVGGRRAVSSIPCDRVYGTNSFTMCLRIDRGVLTTFSAALIDRAGATVKTWALPGIPSRTRVSPDSKLVADTAFVTGDAYASVGFSTRTSISSTDGHDYGGLEDFTFIVNGVPTVASDRNFWGVTFGRDDNTFYATGATNGRTYLVRGDLSARTLTTIHETAECPSLSPDGTHVAYKKNISTTATAFWSLAVLDLATGKEKVLPEKRSVDDQVEWLDNTTLLYGLPRADVPGDSDVWSLTTKGSGAPKLYIAHAWSPSVIR